MHMNVLNDKILQISIQCEDCHLPGNGQFTAVCSMQGTYLFLSLHRCVCYLSKL